MNPQGNVGHFNGIVKGCWRKSELIKACRFTV